MTGRLVDKVSFGMGRLHDIITSRLSGRPSEFLSLENPAQTSEHQYSYQLSAAIGQMKTSSYSASQPESAGLVALLDLDGLSGITNHLQLYYPWEACLFICLLATVIPSESIDFRNFLLAFCNFEYISYIS